jgi:iron complex transport system substrate-binding protein
VFVTEWLEPPYSAGHWVPDMVSAAGGIDVAGTSGEPSHRMRWPDVAALDPDVVVLAPCGFDLDRTLSEVVPLDLSAHLLGTPARQESRVFAVDANAMFSRPSPRVVDGVELLAHLLHPGEYPDAGAPWSRIRL